jgi:MFS family permease
MFVMFVVTFGFGTAAVGQALGVAIALVVCAQLVGGVAECLLGPTRNPLTADLAPPELVGRYFGLQSMLFQGGFGAATALGGTALDWSFRGTWIAGALCALAAAAWSMRLDRHIPGAVRLSP